MADDVPEPGQTAWRFPGAGFESPVCGECGVLIVNVEKHTAWHGGSQQADAAAVVVEFLQSVDPQALEQATLLQPDRPAFEVALELLIEQAAGA